MKTVTVVKDKTLGTYGWYMPSGTTVVWQCIYAKLKNQNIFTQDLIECIHVTYPNNESKRRSTWAMINRVDRTKGTENDVKNLRVLADKLKMKLVVKK